MGGELKAEENSYFCFETGISILSYRRSLKFEITQESSSVMHGLDAMSAWNDAIQIVKEIQLPFRPNDTFLFNVIVPIRIQTGLILCPHDLLS